jgi:hypothetical protein
MEGGDAEGQGWVLMFRIKYTTDNLLQHFQQNSNGTYNIVVVGNGPLSEEDRVAINRSENVVRFNDLNYWRQGEPVALRVVRYPSAKPPKTHCAAPIWAMTTNPQFLPANTTTLSWLYEPLLTHRMRFRFWEVLTPTTHQVLEAWESSVTVFDGCEGCGLHCHTNQTSSGASTGAWALSELHALPLVHSLDVYGMNWGGGKEHVDFVYPDVVSTCCTKCTIHPTPTSDYGDSKFHWTLKAWDQRQTLVATASYGAGALFVAVAGAVATVTYVVRRRSKSKKKPPAQSPAPAAVAASSPGVSFSLLPIK